MTSTLQAPTPRTTRARLAAILALGCASLLGTAAQAQTVVPTTAVSVGGLDSNHFIVGHPASPRWVRQPANAQHPAVQLQARAAAAAIDSNAFRVQPPASVRWTVQPQTVLLARVPGQG